MQNKMRRAQRPPRPFYLSYILAPFIKPLTAFAVTELTDLLWTVNSCDLRQSSADTNPKIWTMIQKGIIQRPSSSRVIRNTVRITGLFCRQFHSWENSLQLYMEFHSNPEPIREMSFGDRMLETMNQELVVFPTNEYYHSAVSKNTDHPPFVSLKIGTRIAAG